MMSLPQEWLYCETWCKKDLQETAKTIDLCQNPNTKEYKLDMAKRIGGPDWETVSDYMEYVNALKPGVVLKDDKKAWELLKQIQDTKSRLILEQALVRYS